MCVGKPLKGELAGEVGSASFGLLGVKWLMLAAVLKLEFVVSSMLSSSILAWNLGGDRELGVLWRTEAKEGAGETFLGLTSGLCVKSFDNGELTGDGFGEGLSGFS